MRSRRWIVKNWSSLFSFFFNPMLAEDENRPGVGKDNKLAYSRSCAPLLWSRGNPSSFITASTGELPGTGSSPVLKQEDIRSVIGKRPKALWTYAPEWNLIHSVFEWRSVVKAGQDTRRRMFPAERHNFVLYIVSIYGLCCTSVKFSPNCSFSHISA